MGNSCQLHMIVIRYQRSWRLSAHARHRSAVGPSSDSKADNGRGGSGGDAGDRGGKPWTKKVYKNNDGSYFYNDANGDCHKCDKNGKDTPDQWDAISSRRTALAPSPGHAHTPNSSHSASSSTRPMGSLLGRLLSAPAIQGQVLAAWEPPALQASVTKLAWLPGVLTIIEGLALMPTTVPPPDASALMSRNCTLHGSHKLGSLLFVALNLHESFDERT
ncbi:hypothetical protein DL770_007750 [Monosporascus sp. CRB-9-2]|nr:hypothetical protein DL770_007750 [Monosporascus sp. CRB-9-2]